MNSIEATIHTYYTDRYGSNLHSRFSKLNEEVAELFEAFEIYQGATDPADRTEKEKHLKDELGDVQTVLSHIITILGTSQEELLLNSIVKSKIREFIPNYMKGEKNERI